MALTTTPDRAASRKASEGDLVHGAVQVVDSTLKRDREVDEVAFPAAEEHLLAHAEASDLDDCVHAETEGGDRDGRRRDRDPGRRREVHGAEILEAAGG